jgi:hypothetical protein
LVLRKLEKLAASTPYPAEAETARAKAEELKIHRVIVQVAPATDGGNPGEVAIGHYVVENGDTLVMTDSEGAPIKHRAIEARVKLLPDQTAEQVARGLVRKMHGTDPHAGFYCRLRYSNAGIV